MISLAGRDILHAWGKFIFTGIGLGLLIGVTLTMAGVYRGMVDDGKVLCGAGAIADGALHGPEGAFKCLGIEFRSGLGEAVVKPW